ncbi:MAG: hypothetical protein JNM76_03900 [Betaproteobacteria bacterium]|nr:hypothetical protein [Betaproteobacteria bacterium]
MRIYPWLIIEFQSLCKDFVNSNDQVHKKQIGLEDLLGSVLSAAPATLLYLVKFSSDAFVDLGRFAWIAEPTIYVVGLTGLLYLIIAKTQSGDGPIAPDGQQFLRYRYGELSRLLAKLFLILLMALAASSVWRAAGLTSQHESYFSGKLVNLATSEPIVGAKVSLADSEKKVISEGVWISDSSGGFSIGLKKPVKADDWLIVQHRDCLTQLEIQVSRSLPKGTSESSGSSNEPVYSLRC